jgi:SAM-dependent methyltransferase
VLDDAARYGESFADVYDDWYGSSFDTDGAVERLAALARGGPTLELGVGTGRLAVPLAARGVLVVGVDASPSMLAQLDLRLAAEPPAAPGRVLPLGADMAEVASAVGAAPEVPSHGYRLVFCAYNTFLNLHTEAAQRRCLAGVAELLADDGSLVVEAYVPAGPDDIPRTSLDVSRVTTTRVVLTCTEHDPRTQLVTGQHVELTDGAVRLRPWQIRYLSTEQLDAMAAEAGLELRERWADWRGTPFRDGSDDDPDDAGGEISETHVSVYGRTRDQVS